jgi:hypothetical protein
MAPTFEAHSVRRDGGLCPRGVQVQRLSPAAAAWEAHVDPRAIAEAPRAARCIDELRLVLPHPHGCARARLIAAGFEDRHPQLRKMSRVFTVRLKKEADITQMLDSKRVFSLV